MFRELRDDDLPRLAGLVRDLMPTLVVSEHTLDHMRKSTAWWVVDEGPALIAAARAGRSGRCWVGVAAAHRRQGLGTMLADLVEERVRDDGHEEAVAWTDGGDAASFATARGYRIARTKPVSVLKLEDSRPAPVTPPAGVALVPLLELDHRLRELYELAMRAYADVPDSLRDAEQTFEEWLRDDLGVPELDFQGSVVAVVDDRLAALSFITTDGLARAENEFTGTHPDFRGRGLATLVKQATIEWCRARGIREIWTGNDSENVPMLAINRKLGYVQAHTRVMRVKRVAAGA